MTYIILSNLPWFWLSLAILFVIIEAMTISLTTIWFALSALIMIFISFTPIPLIIQTLVFLVIAIILLLFTRPIALKKMHIKKTRTNADAAVGKKAIVTKKITEHTKGQIILKGMPWSAEADKEVFSESYKEISVDTEITIMSIRGATVIVKPLIK